MKLNDGGFEIKRLGTQDILLFKKLIRLFREVFKMENRKEPGDSYLQKVLEKPGFFACAILNENEIAGGLTGYELPLYYTEYSEVFIYDIAISPEFQRRGLGKKLLSALKEICRESGIKEIFVAAHEEDKNAIEFYKSAGGKGERVVHFNYETNR